MEEPTNSYQTGLQWLYKELINQLNSRNSSLVEKHDLIAWYLRYGFSLGYKRVDLESSLLQQSELHQIAITLSDIEVLDGKPVPEYSIGENVEVIINGRNVSYHCGSIISLTWHQKDSTWYYLLEENGKKISKRYEARDIRLVNV